MIPLLCLRVVPQALPRHSPRDSPRDNPPPSPPVNLQANLPLNPLTLQAIRVQSLRHSSGLRVARPITPTCQLCRLGPVCCLLADPLLDQPHSPPHNHQLNLYPDLPPSRQCPPASHPASPRHSLVDSPPSARRANHPLNRRILQEGPRHDLAVNRSLTRRITLRASQRALRQHNLSPARPACPRSGIPGHHHHSQRVNRLVVRHSSPRQYPLTPPH
jgi:hypothetical protein